MDAINSIDDVLTEVEVDLYCIRSSLDHRMPNLERTAESLKELKDKIDTVIAQIERLSN